MGHLNRIRTRLGLRKLYAYEHEEGEIALLADVPQFNPTGRLPPHVRYIGPLTWHNTLPRPACIDSLRADRTTVYFSLGSEGLEELVVHLGQLNRQGI